MSFSTRVLMMHWDLAMSSVFTNYGNAGMVFGI